MQPPFVDCHSHVVASGDDGAQTRDDGEILCASAAAHGTRLLFATPHVWPHLPLTTAREEEIERAFASLRRSAPLELRLGWELTPTEALLREDPRRYVLRGTDCVLLEVLFTGELDVVVAFAERVEAHGLRPVIAHPERARVVLEEPNLAHELAARGWSLQINATSITGWEGPEIEALAWHLVDNGLAAIVASDGHRPARPPHLDAAYELVRARLGAERTLPLFDGTALDLAASARRAA
jgi:protein-tyrosine phosphatase